MSVTLRVEGMICEHCEHRVEKAVLAVSGVVSARASAEEGTLVFEGGETAAVITAVEDAGYDVIQ